MRRSIGGASFGKISLNASNGEIFNSRRMHIFTKLVVQTDLPSAQIALSFHMSNYF